MKKAGRILPMNKPQKESQRLTSWLADAIMTEMAKPEEEIDVEFVESCENLLNTIMGEKKLTDEEIEVRVNKIMESRANPRVVPKKRKTAFIAIIAAVVFLISGITVCATTPISQYILKTLDLGLNESVSGEGIVYSYGGKSINYASIEEFLDAEDLKICYPEKFAYDIKLSQILKIETEDQIVFKFDNPIIVFEIYQNKEIDESQFIKAEIIEYNGYSFYIYNSNDNTSIAYFVINSNLYNLGCDSKEKLIEMIHSLNFERIE